MQNQRLPGQWFQLEAGLHYDWHRHDGPTTGRYTSADPLGLFLCQAPPRRATADPSRPSLSNRLSETKTVSGTTTTSTYTYPTTSNRLSSIAQGTTTTRAFTYDAAGNTTQDVRGGTAYNYTISDAGRISQVKVGTTVNANYSYDAKNRLSVRQTLNMSPAGTAQYLYDIWDHLLAETDGAEHAIKHYVWTGDEPSYADREVSSISGLHRI